MIVTIHSELLARDIFIIEGSDEGKLLVNEGKPRPDIYYRHEIWNMIDYTPEAVLAAQRIKDVFGRVVVMETQHPAPVSIAKKREAAVRKGRYQK